MLLLDHVGAKSGVKRTTPLVYVADGRDIVIVASKGGHPKHPAWYHNLRAHPDITIQVGDTVTWTVTKAIADPHSVTSGTPSDSGKQFDSKATLHANGDTFSQTFNTAGSFPYYCIVHPSQMHGTITVLGAAGSGAPATSPGASSAPASSGAPSASGSPGPGALPEVDKPPVSGTDKLIAAGILGAALVILFGAASLWRRVNR